ncbi:MAG: oxidoreductase, partial [Myxococcales bacterium]|nr:oxidoreductase [Myxococcales bacterium]
MNSQKPRIALIGHGYWGKNLARNLSEQGILSAIVDSHYESLDAARKLYPSIPCLSDINEVLTDPNIDAVMIATPAITHASLGLAALQADKDVFLEKPLALNIQEGAALVEEAESRGRILMVGHLLEYHPAVREIERQVKNGDLGGLRYIYSNRLNWGRLRREENILWSFAPHDISVVLRLVGSLPKRIQATGGAWIAPDVHDLTVTVLEFSGGVRAHIYVSWLHPHKEQRLVVTGERSVMVFEDSAVEPTRKLRSYAHSVEWLDNAPVAQKAPEESVAFDSVEPLRLECEAFVEAIQTRTPPRTDGRSALRVLQVLEAAQRSLGLGGEWVEIESPTPPIPDVFVHPT